MTICEHVSSVYRHQFYNNTGSHKTIYTYITKEYQKHNLKSADIEFYNTFLKRHPMIIDMIMHHEIGVLRRYFSGIHTYTPSAWRQPCKYSFPHETYRNYSTIYRRSTDILFQNISSSSIEDTLQTQHNQSYRLLPKQYQSVLYNTRILSRNGLSELLKAKIVAKEVKKLNNDKHVVDEKHLVSFLRKSVYLLHEHRFLMPSENRIEKSKSIVLLPRNVPIVCEATLLSNSILETSFMSPILMDIFKHEKRVNIVCKKIQRNQLSSEIQHCTIIHIKQHNNAYHMTMEETFDFDTDGIQHYNLTLDHTKHNVTCYEVLKRNVHSKMKNVLFEDLPYALQQHTTTHLRHACTNYIVMN